MEQLIACPNSFTYLISVLSHYSYPHLSSLFSGVLSDMILYAMLSVSVYIISVHWAFEAQPHFFSCGRFVDVLCCGDESCLDALA